MSPIVVSIAVGLLPIAADPPQEGSSKPAAAAPAPTGGAPAAPAPASAIEEDIAYLEALLRLRETHVMEAERFLALEEGYVEQDERERAIGVSTPRQTEMRNVRASDAATWVVIRRAERDEVAILLERARRIADSPSPESDLDERRYALECEVRIGELRLRASRARLEVAEAALASEEHSRDQFVRAFKVGVTSPAALKQSTFRILDTRNWRNLMDAEAAMALVRLQRAQRRLAQFDDPSAPDPTAEHPDRDELAVRVEGLEHLVDVLRDEMYRMQDELRGFRYQQHERFGVKDRFGMP